MSRNRRLAWSVIAAAASTILVSSCASSGSGSSSSSSGGGGGYQIGFSDGIGGNIASVAVPELDAVKAVFNATNAAGGINGHKIDLITLDSGDLGSGRAESNVIQLATANHVTAILGMQISNDCTSAASAAANNETPLLCMFAAPTDINPPKPYVYITADVETQEIPAQLKLMSMIVPKNAPKVTIVTNHNIGADNWAHHLQSALQGKASSVDLIDVPADATSSGPYVSKVVSDRSDIVFWEGDPNWEGDLITAFKNSNQDPPIVPTLGDAYYPAYATYPNLYGIALAQPLQPGTSALTAEQKALISQYAALGFKTAAAVNAAPAALALMGPEVVVAALKICGYPCSGTQMAAALNKVTDVSVPGIVPPGTFGYSSTDHAGPRAYTFLHWDPSASKLVSLSQTFPAGPILQ